MNQVNVELIILTQDLSTTINQGLYKICHL